MRYRIAYITLTGELKNKNFDTKKQLDDFIFDKLETLKRGRCIDKETKEVWCVDL